jgi:hypothetical protein
MVRSLDWCLYAFVRKEAVVSSQFEGTRATLVDLLAFEAESAEAPSLDVEEVCNYLDALSFARRQLADEHGLPLSMRLLGETHRHLMRGARGATKLPGDDSAAVVKTASPSTSSSPGSEAPGSDPLACSTSSSARGRAAHLQQAVGLESPEQVPALGVGQRSELGRSLMIPRLFEELHQPVSPLDRAHHVLQTVAAGERQRPLPVGHAPRAPDGRLHVACLLVERRGLAQMPLAFEASRHAPRYLEAFVPVERLTVLAAVAKPVAHAQAVLADQLPNLAAERLQRICGVRG